ncbi:MAG: DUF1611 domain-containing protein [Pseudomonadota bacterium]
MNTLIPETAKWAFTTRNVDKTAVKGIISELSRAKSGDLVLAEIVKLGSHKRIQLASGRNATSHEGDLVVLCCGARYAPDQFEGIAELDTDICDLLAGGGIIGKKLVSHESISNPTQLKPVGLLTYADGSLININDFAIRSHDCQKTIQVIAVTGTAMNSGKTTSAFSLVNGLTKLGKKVAALKVTGTGAFGDFNAFADAGAKTVLDFTDAGMATTYRQPIDRIVEGAISLISHVANIGADVAVVELGDGILQDEAWQLLNHPSFKEAVDCVMFAAPDALSAIAGLNYVNQTELPITAVSGLLTRSPLLCDEYQKHSETPVLSKSQLSDPLIAQCFLGSNTEAADLKAFNFATQKAA